MSPEELARIIDHTLLKPEATPAQIEQLCVEAVQYRFYAVCVNPCWVTAAAAALRGHAPRVCSVVGFPLGANRSDLKAAEADAAVHDGASEIDMVLNLGRLCGGDFRAVEDDIRAVRRALPSSIVLKVIVEAAALPEALKREAAQLAVVAGADFVKTSTGFHPAGGATVADVALLREVVGERAQVKASGGIRTLAVAREMLAAGAHRLGLSASVAIMEELLRVTRQRPAGGRPPDG